MSATITYDTNLKSYLYTAPTSTDASVSEETEQTLSNSETYGFLSDSFVFTSTLISSPDPIAPRTSDGTFNIEQTTAFLERILLTSASFNSSSALTSNPIEEIITNIPSITPEYSTFKSSFEDTEILNQLTFTAELSTSDLTLDTISIRYITEYLSQIFTSTASQETSATSKNNLSELDSTMLPSAASSIVSETTSSLLPLYGLNAESALDSLSFPSKSTLSSQNFLSDSSAAQLVQQQTVSNIESTIATAVEFVNASATQPSGVSSFVFSNSSTPVAAETQDPQAMGCNVAAKTSLDCLRTMRMYFMLSSDSFTIFGLLTLGLVYTLLRTLMNFRKFKNNQFYLIGGVLLINVSLMLQYKVADLYLCYITQLLESFAFSMVIFYISKEIYPIVTQLPRIFLISTNLGFLLAQLASINLRAMMVYAVDHYYYIYKWEDLLLKLPDFVGYCFTCVTVPVFVICDALGWVYYYRMGWLCLYAIIGLKYCTTREIVHLLYFGILATALEMRKIWEYSVMIDVVIGASIFFVYSSIQYKVMRRRTTPSVLI